MNERRQNLVCLFLDITAAILAWTLFFVFRKIYIEPLKYGYSVPVELDANYFWAIVLMPVFWTVLYGLGGSYKRIYRKSRANELIRVFVITFLGCIVLFFTVLLDDVIPSYHVYPYMFSVLLLLQFGITYSFRFIYLTYLKNRIKRKEIGFNTIMAGEGEEAAKLFREIESHKVPQGYSFQGYVTTNGNPHDSMDNLLPRLGSYESLPELVDRYEVEDVIVALDNTKQKELEEIVRLLEFKDVNIKILPQMYDIVAGKVKMDYIFGTALIELNSDLMAEWQMNLKRVMDVGVSALVLTFALPLYLIIAIAIKLDSKGPALYSQQRIGLYARPFKIYKFRTMHQNAERQGPMLSSDYDPRVTKVGRVLRKYRLDELPQFFNVLKGDMSLVGPRPERQYFINKIVEVAPHYQHLWKTKPGITSWGQVKFGYAENVEEMVERLKFDILYIENMSLLMDLKILFYTVLIVFKGSGK